MRNLLWLCLIAPALSAQAPASGVYRIYQSKSELGRESFSGSDTLFRQTVIIPTINLKIESVSRRTPVGRFGGFELSLRNAAGDSLLGSYHAKVSGDSVTITSDLPKAPPPRTRSASFDLVMPPQSLASLAWLVTRSAGRDTVWRVLMAGTDTVIETPVHFAGDTAHIRLGGIEIIAHDSAGRVQSMEIPVQRARAEYVAADVNLPVLANAPRPKPDYSAPTGANYSAEQVRVPVQPAVGDTFSLGCTLTIPRTGRPPYPAAITITGSGLQGRDEDLWPLVPNYRPFRQVAERLAGAGIATLRCDDRGKDASTGDPAVATTVDLAGDTKAQLTWLRARSEINPAKIALVGHSEGGIIGPMVGVEDPRLAALVIMAGTAKAGRYVLRDQARWPIIANKELSASDRATQLASADSTIVADSAAPGAWYQWFYHYDPLPTARKVKQPTLILQGALDRQVSAGQADTLARAIRSGGNKRVTLQVFPGLNHLFLPSPTDGSPGEYGTLTVVALPANVLDLIVVWLSKTLK